MPVTRIKNNVVTDNNITPSKLAVTTAMQTFLGNATSVNLASAVNGTTGTGNLVFANNSTLSGTTIASGTLGVGVSTMNTSARLQVDSTTQGFLPPRMSISQRNAIATPAAGLTVYTTDGFNMSYHNGTSWGDVFSSHPASFTSATLAAAVSDETGTGSLVFADSPTFQTPRLASNNSVSVLSSLATSQRTNSFPDEDGEISLKRDFKVSKNSPVPRYYHFDDFVYIDTLRWAVAGGSTGNFVTVGASTSNALGAYGVGAFSTGNVSGNSRTMFNPNGWGGPLGSSVQMCFCVTDFTSAVVNIGFTGGGSTIILSLDSSINQILLTAGGNSGTFTQIVEENITFQSGDFTTGSKYRVFLSRITATTSEVYLAVCPSNSSNWVTIVDSVVTHPSHIGGWSQSSPLIGLRTLTNAVRTMNIDWIAHEKTINR